MRTRKQHFLTAAVFWSGVGLALFFFGVLWVWRGFAPPWVYLWLLLCLLIGLLKGEFAIGRSAKRSITRIQNLPRRSPFYQVFTKVQWGIVLGMMLLGFLIRHLPIDKSYRGLVLAAVGAALLWASRYFWKEVCCPKVPGTFLQNNEHVCNPPYDVDTPAKVPVPSKKVPGTLGHYSQIVRAGDFFFLSGQIAIDPATNVLSLFDGDAAKQAELILHNIEAILASEGLTKANIIKMVIHLTDMTQFGKVNEVYAAFFGPHKPARTTVGVAVLPKGAAVEIEAVAARPT